MYKSIIVLKFSDECAVIEAQSWSRHQSYSDILINVSPSRNEMAFFGAKSAVF